jgi:hypothetical protein
MYAPIRFTRGTISSDSTDDSTMTACQSESGSAFTEAAVQDVASNFKDFYIANPSPWSARGSIYGYRMDPQGKSHFTLARISSWDSSVVACRVG